MVGAWFFGYRLNVPTASVPVPSAGASPDQVVLAYVEAYNHRDFDAMAAIYPAAGRPDRYRAMGTMRDLTISSSGPDSTGPSDRARWAVRVQLRFTGLRGSDLAYDEGPNGWAYHLEPIGPDRAWRIVDQGNG